MKWNFPINNTGQIQGISNPGIETFKGNPIRSLAREICQNSLDACESSEVNVQVDFKTFSLNRNNFPDIDGLRGAFTKGESFWNDMNDRKAASFFRRGNEILESNTINCLRISDFKTTGLRGSREEFKSPWANLTRSSGVSDKSGSSGGSFGVGKFAPFANSELRTVFYSTRDDKEEDAFQGITRLTSFTVDHGNMASDIGYYSKGYPLPDFHYKSVDESFNRHETDKGTDILIAGFADNESKWENEILSSILDGFLLAIYYGKLTVLIEETIISKDTLKDIIYEYKDTITKSTSDTYSVLVSKETKYFEENFRNMGKIRLSLLLAEDLDRKVSLFRKTGMKIKDEGGISSLISFAGILEIEGEEINAFLRSIENPEHTKWEPERSSNPPKSRLILRDLKGFIKRSFESLSSNDLSDSIDPVLGTMLLEEESDNEELVESLSNEISEIEITEVITRTSASRKTYVNDDTDEYFVITDDGDDSVEGIATRSKSRDTGKNGSKLSKKSDSDKQRGVSVSEAIYQTRVLCVNKEEGKYLITFKTKKEIDKPKVEISLVSESQNYKAPIIRVLDEMDNALQFVENKIFANNITQSKVTRLIVYLDFYEYCSMEVNVYGN